MNKKQKVLFVVMAIIGVLLTLQINGALAAESTKPLKCTYPAMTLGGIEVIKGRYANFVLFTPTTITVLEEVILPIMDADGKKAEEKFYRFDAAYDKPVLFCPIHGPEPFEIYSKAMPADALDRFFLTVSEGLCK